MQVQHANNVQCVENMQIYPQGTAVVHEKVHGRRRWCTQCTRWYNIHKSNTRSCTRGYGSLGERYSARDGTGTLRRKYSRKRYSGGARRGAHENGLWDTFYIDLTRYTHKRNSSFRRDWLTLSQLRCSFLPQQHPQHFADACSVSSPPPLHPLD